jgi:hypothetical protein
MTNNLELLKNHLYKLIKEELEGGEEEKQAGFEKVMYDLVLEPANIQDALTALSDIKNYGIYANNLRDPKVITKIFGPSVPATKGRVAKETWDSMNDTEKNSKVIDIKNRAPQEWTKVEEKLKDKFDEWSIENDNDSFNEFIISLSASELPMEFFGKYAATFYPMKTPDNLKKYSGVMAKDKDFVVNGDKIVFPQKKNPFETKDYLTKVLKTIMGNAKLQYSISQKESDDQPATTSNTQGKVEKINFVKTFDTPELAAKFKKLVPKDFAEKTTIDGSKITVADITDSQKKNLILSAQKFIESQPKKPMKESIKDQIKQAVMEVLQEERFKKGTDIGKKNKKGVGFKAVEKAAEKEYGSKEAGKKVAGAILKKVMKEGETSMDDILLAFQAALDIQDDAEQDKALQAVYNELENKVKTKAGNLYQKVRTGFAKSQGIDPSELSEARVNSNTEDRISYLKDALQHVWNMGKGNNMIDFNSMAKSTVSDLFDDTLNEAEEETDAVDTITMDVPLFIRMLEYAREDASADVDLHDVAENAVSLNKDQEVLSMDDYDALLPSDAEQMDEAKLKEDLAKDILNTSQESALNSYIKNPATLAQALLAIHDEIMSKEKFDPKTTAPFKIALDNLAKLANTLKSSPQTQNTPTQPEKP